MGGLLMLDITIDGIKYEYVDSIIIDDINYIAISDGNTITINKYIIDDNNIELLPIDDITFDKVRREMGL
jgi:hypothetical protein